MTLRVIAAETSSLHRRNSRAVSVPGKVRADGRTGWVSSRYFGRDSQLGEPHGGFFPPRVTVLEEEREAHVVSGHFMSRFTTGRLRQLGAIFPPGAIKVVSGRPAEFIEGRFS